MSAIPSETWAMLVSTPCTSDKDFERERVKQKTMQNTDENRRRKKTIRETKRWQRKRAAERSKRHRELYEKWTLLNVCLLSTNTGVTSFWCVFAQITSNSKDKNQTKWNEKKCNKCYIRKVLTNISFGEWIKLLSWVCRTGPFMLHNLECALALSM